VDNIPGVQGVGPKTATELLQQFGSIDSLFARLDQVESPRLRAKLTESQDVVRRNQDLIRLRTDVARDFDLEFFRTAQPDVPRLMGLFSDWGFRTLREELEKAQTVQHELF
jgi:DNA polymerase-1